MPTSGESSPLGSISVQLRHICLEYSYAQIEAATMGFHESRRLGSGTAGTVYLGEMPDGSDVAVKAIDLATLGDDSMVAGFEEEIAVLSKFRHPNLVVLMGWAREGTRRFLIYEFLTGGDVFQRLQKCKEQKSGAPFPWAERLGALRDAATGLAHLHNATPRAFHRDVKSANILLGGSGAKMADFGLSCVAKTRKDQDVLCEFPSGTPGYTCPNYIRSGKVTEGSEVFSFGMVMLEVLMNMMPAGMVNGSLVYPIQEKVGPDHPGAAQRAVALADQLARWPRALAGEIAALALRCVSADDAQRPRFNEVCRTLREVQKRYPAGAEPEPPPPPPPPMPGSSVVPQRREASHWQGQQPPLPAGGGTFSNGGKWQEKQPRASPERTPETPSPETLQPKQRPSGGGGPYAAAWTPDRSTSPPSAAAGAPPPKPQRSATPQGRVATTPPQQQPPPPLATAEAGHAGAAWPAGADVALEVVYLHGVPVNTLPPGVRLLTLEPKEEEGSSRRCVQIGRHRQLQWFEALLVDPVHRNSVSRVACEVSWGGGEQPASLTTLGSNLLVVDGSVVPKDHTAPLFPGSQIRFMFQADVQIGDLLVLVAHPVPAGHALGPGPSLSAREGDTSTSDASASAATVETRPPPVVAPPARLPGRPPAGPLPPPPPQAAMPAPQHAARPLQRLPPSRVLASVDLEERWRLECIYAAACTPEAFAAMPASNRTVSFPLPAGAPSVILGRQHQMGMFEALLFTQMDLLAFVSRNHFQLDAESGAPGWLRVTNLSQNISIVGTRMLMTGESVCASSGDTLSFAAQADLVPHAHAACSAVQTCDGVEHELAPFLTFRLIAETIPAPHHAGYGAAASHPAARPRADSGAWDTPDVV